LSKIFEELRTSLGGVEFKNPFVLGSAPPTWDADHIIRAAKLGWAGAVHKTIAMKEAKDPSPRMYARKFLEDVFSVQNIELISTYSKEQWAKWNKRIKAETPSDFVLISSLMGVPDPQTWIEPLQLAQESGADMIELNVSCPHGSPEHYMGAFVGQDANLTKTIVQYVKRYAKVPVIVKLTPNVTDVVPVAKAALEAGADAFTIANTHGPVMSGVDIEGMIPAPNVRGKGAFGGMSGPAVKPNTLRLVAEVKTNFRDAHVFGLGGIENWRDAVEFMSLGARGVQVVTGVMIHGYELIDDLVMGTRQFLKEQRYDSVLDIVGKALPNLSSHSDLSFEDWARVWVDPAVCVPCTRCAITCSVVGSGAMTIDPVQLVAVSDPEDCKGCGLCVTVCPTGAIQLLPEAEATRRYKSVRAAYPSVEYSYPRTLQEAVSALEKHPEAILKAGGTDILVKMKQGQSTPAAVVDLKEVEGLSYVKPTKNGVAIGSATTMRELVESSLLREKLPVIPETAEKMALPEVREIATIGGNLCNASPAADLVPILLALEATVQVIGPNGPRAIPAESLFLGPGRTCLQPNQILTEVDVPYLPDGARVVFIKTGRTFTDIAQVNVAVAIRTKDGVIDYCRIAVGSVAPTPLRVPRAEKALLGKHLNEASIKEAALIVTEDIKPISDSRGTAKQRRESAELLTRRALWQAGGLL